MPISEREALLALHRKLYLLEEKEDKISSDARCELYSLLKLGIDALAPEQKEYILGLITHDDLERVRRLLARCEENGIRVITWSDDSYPIHYISDPPPVLFVRGRFPDQAKMPYLAIVGSRKATPYGREWAARIVGELKEYDVTIVSGMAYGIDGCAHRAAIDCGLMTVAVLGCGIDQTYPASHQGLKDEIAKNGAVISEFPCGTPPLKHNFPMRNRVISGLSRGVFVVEAEIRSGSLITARWAADQGRECFALPGNAGRAMSSGTNLLIKEGAQLVECGGDIARALNLTPRNQTALEKNSGHCPEDDDIKRAILNFLKEGGNNLENLIEETKLSASELLPLITGVELEL